VIIIQMCIELEIPQALHGELQQYKHALTYLLIILFHPSVDFNKNSMRQYYQTTSRAISHWQQHNKHYSTMEFYHGSYCIVTTFS